MPKAMQQCAVRAGRKPWWLLAIVLPLLFLLACPPALAAKAAKAQDSAPADEPVRRLQTLLARKSPPREALKRVEADLETARAAKPDGQNGAKATFFLARAQEEIARRSGAKADWAKAADTFGAYLDRFSRHMLAPEALYRRGLIRLNRLGDADGAAADFQAILKSHASSARAAKAKSLLRSAARASSAAGPAAAPPAVAAKKPDPDPAPQSQQDDRPTLLGLRIKNHPQTTRVILDLESRVRYRYQQLGEARVYVDLLGADVGAGVREEQSLAGGLLRHVRVATRRGEGFVRVVLDFAELKDFSVQVLDAPFRIVLDAQSRDAKPDKPDKADKNAAKAQPDDQPDRTAPAFAAPKGSRKKLAANLVEQLGLSVRTIMIDAGHGGKDPGARGFGLQEKDIALRMALALGKELKNRGFRVIYTRTTDDFLPLEDRTALANTKKADLFLSVHCNAHTDQSIHGLETFSLNLAKTPDEVRVAARENAVSDKNISDLQMILTDLMLTSKIKESVELARGVQRRTLAAVRSRWSLSDHGNREAPFYVLMGAKMPSALIEIGYITNKAEAARLNTDAYLKTLAHGIADGVVEYKQQIERFTARQGAK
jgi:N-acetylmuramoyl-L-alanine amidase